MFHASRFMIHTELQQEIKRYLPALTLDRLFPRFLRLRLLKIFAIFIVTLFIFQGLLFGADQLLFTIGIVEPNGILALLLSFSVPFYGLLLIALSLGFTLLMLESFFNTVYFRGTRYRSREDRKNGELAPPITYEAADILSRSYSDLTDGFVSSRYGKEILARCNIHKKDLRTFIEGERTKILPKVLLLPQKDFFSLSALSQSIIEHDKAFADFLFQHGVSESVYSGAAAWVARTIAEDKERAQWWTRENLARVQGIGKDWGYGGAYQLVRFAKDIALGSVFSSLGESSNYRKDKVEQLEIILARTKEANVLLVGEQGVGKRDIIIQLQQKIESGAALPQLEDRRMLALDTDLFIATYGDKTSFERELLILLGQAHDAGNVILVIENMTAFIKNAEAIGSDIVAIMDPYLSGTQLQVLATSDPISFHKVLEARPQLMQRFEVVQAEGADQAVTIRVIEDIARMHEKRYKLLFTYSAVATILESADRYIVGGVMPDKAVDLLIELLPVAMSKKVRIITKEFVYEYVKEKTGIPVGAVSGEERDVLLHLEDILHKRIVGQEQAVATISNAMRRARAGIQNPNRPLGSFLFLGPTGVGKTETTKATTPPDPKITHPLRCSAAVVLGRPKVP